MAIRLSSLLQLKLESNISWNQTVRFQLDLQIRRVQIAHTSRLVCGESRIDRTNKLLKIFFWKNDKNALPTNGKPVLQESLLQAAQWNGCKAKDFGRKMYFRILSKVPLCTRMIAAKWWMIHADAFEDSQVRELNSSVILCNYIPTLFGELGFELERRLPSNLMQFVINWWPGRETVDSRIRRFTLSLSLRLRGKRFH